MPRIESVVSLHEVYAFLRRNPDRIDWIVSKLFPENPEDIDQADALAKLIGEQNHMRVITSKEERGLMLSSEFDGIHSIWTGIANQCVSVLVTHPIAAGASRRKTITRKDVKDFYNTASTLSEAEFVSAVTILTGTDEDAIKRSLAPISVRKDVLKVAIDTAVAEFRSGTPIAKDRLPQNTTVSITGICYSTVEEIMALRQAAREHCNFIQADLICHPEYIGMKGGIAYGGVLHSQYNFPTFVTV